MGAIVSWNTAMKMTMTVTIGMLQLRCKNKASRPNRTQSRDCPIIMVFFCPMIWEGTDAKNEGRKLKKLMNCTEALIEMSNSPFTCKSCKILVE